MKKIIGYSILTVLAILLFILLVFAGGWLVAILVYVLSCFFTLLILYAVKLIV